MGAGRPWLRRADRGMRVNEAVDRIARDKVVVVVSWMHRVVLGGFCLVFGAVLASAIFRDSGPVFAIPGLALLVVGVLAARGGRVEFRPDELVIRQTWRTRRIPRQDVTAVGVTRGSNVAGLPWRVPFFKPSKGPIVTVEEIRSLRTGTVVDRVVEIRRQWADTPD